MERFIILTASPPGRHRVNLFKKQEFLVDSGGENIQIQDIHNP
jgi:hypothetical protein